MKNIVAAAGLAGFFGDILLQTGSRMGLGGPTGWGLKEYFALHGSAEATCVAAGMMSLFMILYVATGLPITYVNLALYGILLDFLFRTFNIFPSLQGYYEYFNYFWSAVWGAIPLMLPYFIQQSAIIQI
jgi:hypothetical protein